MERSYCQVLLSGRTLVKIQKGAPKIEPFFSLQFSLFLLTVPLRVREFNHNLDIIKERTSFSQEYIGGKKVSKKPGGDEDRMFDISICCN